MRIAWRTQSSVTLKQLRSEDVFAHSRFLGDGPLRCAVTVSMHRRAEHVTTSAAVRAQAARVLASVLQGRSLDTALQVDPQWNAQDRGLLRSLCYDSARWYLRLDPLLNRLFSRPNQQLAPELRALAIVGLCQLLYTKIPAHAAVAETVEAARLLGHPRAAGLINALLRRCLREHVSLLTSVDADLAIRTAHPSWFAAQLERDWPEDFQTILNANNERPPFWVRVNRRQTTGSRYRVQLESAGMQVAMSMFDEEALCLERAVDVSELPGFSAGQVSVQDAAAQLAARALDAQPGDRVLDACAAPGGKTGHLLELQPELAELVAVDVSGARLARVEENLQRLGLHATLVNADAAMPATWWSGAVFNRIVLDVPCSATGVIRRHPDIKLLRRASDIPALAAQQALLLQQMWPLLAQGGRLLYASCSALKAETCDVVAAFLSQTGDATDVTAGVFGSLGMDPGEGPGYRIAAGTRGMDGFYYACLRKND